MLPLTLYTPHSNQIKVHSSQKRYRVVVAGRRFGKTALALNECIYRALQLKNQIMWIILPHLKQAKEVYWIDPDVTRYFMPLVQQGIFKKNDSDLSLLCKHTNSWIRLKGADNYESLRGSGIDLIVWDEDADTKPEAHEVIKPALADSPYHRQLFIGTPKGLNHFHDFALKGDHSHIIPSYEKPYILDSEWETFHFTSYDNMTWPDGSYERQQFVKFIDKEQQEAEEKGRLAFYMQEYMASFEESAGRFFPKWSYRVHVLPRPIDLRHIPHIFATIDWGRAAPMAWHAHAVIECNYEGIKFNRIITFKEVYGTNKSPYEQAVLIQKELPYTYIKRTYIDPSTQKLQEDGNISVLDQFVDSFTTLSGTYPQFIRAMNNRPSRWAAMDNWMRIAPDKLPYWMITPNCTNLIRTLPLMMPDPNKIEDIDTTLEDHAVDGVSYGIQYIKWVDAFAGITHRPVIHKSPLGQIKPPIVVNPEKFGIINSKGRRDWRSV